MLNQEPCIFAVSYSAQQRSDTGTFTDPLPNFIDIDSGSNELIINPTSLEDIAVYVIRIQAFLDNFDQTMQTEISFTIAVVCSPDNFEFSVIEDKTITIGAPQLTFFYQLSEQPCAYGIAYTVFMQQDDEDFTQ